MSNWNVKFDKKDDLSMSKTNGLAMKKNKAAKLTRQGHFNGGSPRGVGRNNDQNRNFGGQQ